jgi:hypothetical protein
MGTDPALAEYLPVLYRDALDSLDELARSGGRAEAARLRRKAGQVYSKAWDDRCRRDLEAIIQRAHLSAATSPPDAAPPGSLVAAG